MKPSIEWCRRCLASHAPGEHVKRAGASSPPAVALKASAPAKRTKPATASKKPAKPARKLNPAAPTAKKAAKRKKPAAKAKAPPVKRVSVAELTPAERDTLAAAELRRRACDAQRARRFRKRQRLAEARA